MLFEDLVLLNFVASSSVRVVRKEQGGSGTSSPLPSPPLPSLPSPSLPFPFPSIPSLPVPLLPPLPSLPLPLEVGPLIAARESGGAL